MLTTLANPANIMINNFKPIRVPLEKSPYLIDNQVWVDDRYKYNKIEVLKTENNRKLLDLSPCIQCCVLHSSYVYLLGLTTEGKIVGTLAVTDEVQSLKIVELIPIPRSDKDILIITEDRILYWCQINWSGEERRSKIVLIHEIARDVESANFIGYTTIRDSSSRPRTGIMMLCSFPDRRSTIIIVDPLNGKMSEQDLIIPEGVKWLEGCYFQYMGNTTDHASLIIVTNTDRILTLSSVNIELVELAVIPGLRDVIRIGCYWLAISDSVNGSKFTIILRGRCGDKQHSIEAYLECGSDNEEDYYDGMYQLHLLPDMILPMKDSIVEFNHEIKFVRFLNQRQLVSESGEIYTYNHNLYNGKIKIKPLSQS